MPQPTPPLVVHIIFRLDIGGLENGLVNLINNMDTARYRHAIICLTEFTDFRARIQRPDVVVHALHKRPGKDVGAYLRLWRLLRKLRPAIVHTRNIGTLDCQLIASLAGIKHRVHGEHGRDIADLDGVNPAYLRLRRILKPLVQRFITVSRDLDAWLQATVPVAPNKTRQIYNGVDCQRFHPPAGGEEPPKDMPFNSREHLIIGSVGRMDPVKDQLTLVRAFLLLLDCVPKARQRLRLVHIGDGPLMVEAKQLLKSAGASDLAWLPGARDDVDRIYQTFDLFVLPSLAEGISNTILEAMASGLPIIATDVGGNSELVIDETGVLVPRADPEALVKALLPYVQNSSLIRAHGGNARERAEATFSIPHMVEQYAATYDQLVSA